MRLDDGVLASSPYMSHELYAHLLTDSQVYVHYTDESGLNGILREGVIRPNFKGVVYLSQEPLKASETANVLFIGATTHEGRGTHILVLRLDLGLPVTRLTTYESSVRQSIRLDQHRVIYAGPNPF